MDRLSPPIPQPRPLPKARDKRAAKREEQATIRSVYRQVDQRDKRQCRVTGSREDLEHHHLKPRSRGGEHTTANVLLVTKLVHALLTQHRIWIVGTDANRDLLFEMTPGIAAVVFGQRQIPKHVRIIDLPRD